MSLHQQIKEELKKAMLAKDQVRLDVMRGLITAFTNELISKKMMKTETLPDVDALAVVKRAAKQRKDSIDQFATGNRADLVMAEKIELEILGQYMLKTMTLDEIRPIVEAKMKELGLENQTTEIGRLVGAVIKELGDKAEGSDVKIVAEQMLK